MHISLIPNWTIIPMWFIFMTVLVSLNRLVFQPTLKVMRERQKHTTGFESDAAQLKTEAEIKIKKYETLMAEAQNRARLVRDEILKAASLKEKEIINQARLLAETELGEVKSRLQHEVRQAREQLAKDVELLAGQMVDQLLGRKAA